MADDARSLPNKALLETSFLSGANATFVEEMYARFVADPNSVDASWRAFFEKVSERPDAVRAAIEGPSWYRAELAQAKTTELTRLLDGDWAGLAQKLERKVAARLPAASAQDVQQAARDSVRALMMIRAYRTRGHLAATLDPLGIEVRQAPAELDPSTHGFAAADFDRPIFIDGVLGLESATLNEMLAILRRTYCANIGVEFMHITDPAEKSWIQERIEGPDKGVSFTPEGKRSILKKLIEGESFEKFVHKRHPGTKRFGLDGGEAMLPAMEQIIKRGGAMGVEEIVLGMAHRGRMNVLNIVMKKSYDGHLFNYRYGDTSDGGAGAMVSVGVLCTGAVARL